MVKAVTHEALPTSIDLHENNSNTMMRGKSPPPEHNNIHVTKNYQLRVSLNEYLERKFPSKKDFWTFF